MYNQKWFSQHWSSF